MGDFDPIASTQIRAIAGFICFALLVTFLGRWKQILKSAKDAEGIKWISIGAIFGPFIGVSLSLFAVQHTSAGIAATLMALTPILIIVPSKLIFKEKITSLQVIGAVVSIVGASIFFL